MSRYKRYPACVGKASQITPEIENPAQPSARRFRTAGSGRRRIAPVPGSVSPALLHGGKQFPTGRSSVARVARSTTSEAGP